MKIDYKIITFLIAAVWLVNGLVCKLLNAVPRHQQIVGRILGEDYARPLTVLIGLAEIGMAGWVLSRIRPRWSAVVQMSVVAVMNVLEFFLVPELLLWGRMNAVFALLFIGLVYYHEFVLTDPLPRSS